MVELEVFKSIEETLASTGRYYDIGRINVRAKTVKEVPWKSGTRVVITYNKEKNEMIIKPLHC